MAAGLDRAGGVDQLDDELIGAVVTVVRPGPPPRIWVGVGSVVPAIADFYELVVARHQRSATIVTSNRGPDEWLTVMTDAMLAESAVDRLTSTAHELIIEGPSYRQPQKPSVDSPPPNADHRH